MHMCSDVVLLMSHCGNQADVRASCGENLENRFIGGLGPLKWMNERMEAKLCPCQGGDGRGHGKLLQLSLGGTEFTHQCVRIILRCYHFFFYNVQNYEVLPTKPESQNSECHVLESRKCIVFHWGPAFVSRTAWSLCGWLCPPPPDETSMNTAFVMGLAPIKFPLASCHWFSLVWILTRHQVLYNHLHVHHYTPVFSKTQTLV